MRLEAGDRVVIRALYWCSFGSGRFVRFIGYSDFTDGSFRNRRRKLVEAGYLSERLFSHSIDGDCNGLGVGQFPSWGRDRGGRPGWQTHGLYSLGGRGEECMKEWLGSGYHPIVRELEWPEASTFASLFAQQIQGTAAEREREIEKWTWRTPQRGFSKRRRRYPKIEPNVVVTHTERPERVFIESVPGNFERLVNQYDAFFSNDYADTAPDGKPTITLFVASSEPSRKQCLEIARQVDSGFAFRIRTRDTAGAWLREWRSGTE